jgi:deoxycytidylate deaminase
MCECIAARELRRVKTELLEHTRDCKQMTVHAIGVDLNGKSYYGKNFNISECTGERGKCGCTHAEISMLSKKDPDVTMDVVIVTHSPCLACAEKLYYNGVKAVYYLNEYRIKDGINYLRSKGVVTCKVTAEGLHHDGGKE